MLLLRQELLEFFKNLGTDAFIASRITKFLFGYSRDVYAIKV